MMIEISPEIAEICGIHAGDGYLRVRERNKGEIDISGSIEEMEYYDSHVIPLFNKIFNLNLSGKIFSRGTYGFVCYKKEPRDTLLNLGFPKGKKSAIVRVPKIILDSEDQVLFARFLRGLFDTDGTLTFRKYQRHNSKFKTKYHNYPVIALTTISKFLTEGVIKMLHDLDINFYYYNQNPRKSTERKTYVIAINGINRLEKWMRLVGMKNNVKLSRYLVWEKFGFCPTNLSLQQRKDILKGKLDPYKLSS